MAVLRPALCVTGALSVPRSQFKADLQSFSFGLVPSPSKNCDLLVVGRKPSRRKIAEALERGIAVFPERAAREVFERGGSFAEAAKQALFSDSPPLASMQSLLLKRLEPFLAPQLARKSQQRSWHWELGWMGYERLEQGQADAGDYHALAALCAGLEALAAHLPQLPPDAIGAYGCLGGPTTEPTLLELVEQQLLLEPAQLQDLCLQAEDELVADGARRIAAARPKAEKQFPLFTQALDEVLETTTRKLPRDLFYDQAVQAAGRRLGLAMAPPAISWGTTQTLLGLVPYSRFQPPY